MNDRPLVYVVDDDLLVQTTLRHLLGTVDLEVRTFAAAAEFLQAWDPSRPACLVADIRMPGMSGLELLQHLQAHGQTLPTVLITGYGDVPTAVEAMKLGAVDFVEKPFRDQVLLDAIQHALKAEVQRRRDQERCRPIADRIAAPTPREREVLELVIAGRSNREMAAQLGVTCRAVESRRAKFMERMHAANITDLVKMVCAARVGAGPALTH